MGRQFQILMMVVVAAVLGGCFQEPVGPLRFDRESLEIAVPPGQMATVKVGVLQPLKPGQLSVSISESWITVRPSDSPNQFEIVVDATQTAEGIYETSVSAKGGDYATSSLPVTVTVTREVALRFGPPVLDLGVPHGKIIDRAIAIEAPTEGGEVTLTVDAPWITLTATSGKLPMLVPIRLDGATLEEGIYTAQIRATSAGYDDVILPITLTVEDPALEFSANELTVSMNPGSTEERAAGLAVTFPGAEFVVGTNAPWLSVSPMVGTDMADLTVAVDSAGMVPGTYTGTITATAPGYQSATFDVTLSVNGCFSRYKIDVLSDSHVSVGWTGLAHNLDFQANKTLLSVAVKCTDQGSCSDCSITGAIDNNHFVGEDSNKRCRLDIGQACSSDADCGGAGPCSYFMPPIDSADVGGLPVCSWPRLVSSVTGTTDFTTRTTSLDPIEVEAQFWIQRCPTCDAGTCNGGVRNGEFCDSQFDCPNARNIEHSFTSIMSATVSDENLNWEVTDETPNCTGSGLESFKCLVSVCNDPKHTACGKNGDCAAAGVCQGGSNVMAACSKDSDCPGSVCSPPPCNRDKDCGSGSCLAGQCSTTQGKCGGKTCLGGTTAGAPCADSSTCGDGGICGALGQPSQPNQCPGSACVRVGGSSYCADTGAPCFEDSGVDSPRCFGGNNDPFVDLCPNGVADCPDQDPSNGEISCTGGSIQTELVKALEPTKPFFAAGLKSAPASAGGVNAFVGLPGPGRVTLKTRITGGY